MALRFFTATLREANPEANPSAQTFDDLLGSYKGFNEVPKEIGQFGTERLSLRPLERADAGTLQLIGTDDVFETVPEIEVPFDAVAWLEHKIDNECPTIGHVIVTRADSIVIGYIQITAVVTKEGAYLSVGYWLGRMYWGRGYATEALTAALNTLQATIGKRQQLIPVHAQIVAENAASRRVLEKCGFVPSDPPNGASNTEDVAWYHWPISAARYHRS